MHVHVIIISADSKAAFHYFHTNFENKLSRKLFKKEQTHTFPKKLSSVFTHQKSIKKTREGSLSLSLVQASG